MDPIKSTGDESSEVKGSRALPVLPFPTAQPQQLIAPPPVIVEIQNRVHLSRLIDNYLFPQESGPEFVVVRQFLAPCAKLEWNEGTSALTVQGINSRDEEMFKLTGPDQTTYLCHCSTEETLLPFKYQGTTILSFSWNSVLCSPCCGSDFKAIEVFVPDRAEPIGKLEYMSGRFSEKSVTITNYITNETFTSSLAENSNPNCPSMLIKNESGTTVALSGVHSARIYRGTTTYMGINVVFPDIGMSSTTKAIMMAFGTVWKVENHRSHGICYSLICFIMLLFAIGILYFWFQGA